MDHLEMRPEEEQLFTTNSVVVTDSDWPEHGARISLPLLLLRWGNLGLRGELAWSLLDHLAKHPVRKAETDRSMLLLHLGGGCWRWRALGTLTRVDLQVYLEVDRIQRFMQLLGMLDHSRVEEWERSVVPG